MHDFKENLVIGDRTITLTFEHVFCVGYHKYFITALFQDCNPAFVEAISLPNENWKLVQPVSASVTLVAEEILTILKNRPADLPD